MKTIKIEDLNSAGIKHQAKIDGVTEVSHIGSNHKLGDERVEMYDFGGVRVMITNGDPIWEEQDAMAFAEMIEWAGVEIFDADPALPAASAPKWIIEIPHTIGKARLYEFTDGYRSSIIDQANKGDGLPDDSDASILDFAGRDLHGILSFADDAELADYAASQEAQRWPGHKAAQVASAIADEAGRDNGLCAALKSKASAFLGRLNPQAAGVEEEAE